MNYNNLTDEELVKLYNENDELAFEFLVKRYGKLINSLTRRYFEVDNDELTQVAYISLERAAKTYVEGVSKFSTYAYTCINSRLINAVKAHDKQKEKVRLHSQVSDYEDVLASPEPSFEDVFIQDESFNELKNKIETVLSKFEIEIFNRYFLKGWSYREIVADMDVPTKKIENAIQRIKIKVKKMMEK